MFIFIDLVSNNKRWKITVKYKDTSKQVKILQKYIALQQAVSLLGYLALAQHLDWLEQTHDPERDSASLENKSPDGKSYFKQSEESNK